MDNDSAVGFVIGMLIGAIVSGFFVGGITKHEWEASTISRGYAIYCPNDGYFAFKGECDK